VLALDGSRRIAGEESGPADRAATIGERLATRLRGLGAAALLA
jgi:porphobilinogen deaminase